MRDESNYAEALGNSPNLKQIQYLKSAHVILHGDCSLSSSYTSFLPLCHKNWTGVVTLFIHLNKTLQRNCVVFCFRLMFTFIFFSPTLFLNHPSLKSEIPVCASQLLSKQAISIVTLKIS